MKVVIAIDSLKGSLSSIEAGMAIKEGVLRAKPDARIVVKPLADGGEGTTDALIEGMNGERIDLTVTGPMHAPVNAYYGYLKDSNTAVMEMASAAGITLVPDDTKDPLLATSYGVGEMINHLRCDIFDLHTSLLCKVLSLTFQPAMRIIQLKSAFSAMRIFQFYITLTISLITFQQSHYVTN